MTTSNNAQARFDVAVNELNLAVVSLLQNHLSGEIKAASFEPRGQRIQGTAHFNGGHTVVIITITSEDAYSLSIGDEVYHNPQMVANMQDLMNQYDRALNDI